MLSLLGERLFRRISLAVQGLAVTVLVMMMLLFPVLSGVTPGLLESGNAFVRWFPPFWFLGMYQRILEGPTALPIFSDLARIGGLATLAAAARGLGVVSAGVYAPRARASGRCGRALDAQSHGGAAEWTSARHRRATAGAARGVSLHRPDAASRAALSDISRALWRSGAVGGRRLGAAVLDAAGSISRWAFRRTASAWPSRIVAFWVIAGMRAAFVSSGNRQGSWALRIVHGQPPHFDAAIEQLTAAKVWVAMCAASVTLRPSDCCELVAPAELLPVRATAAQLLVAMGMCLLLTDAFFLNVTAVPFTGGTREPSNLAFTVLKYFSTFSRLDRAVSVASQFLIERSGGTSESQWP